MAAFNLQKVSGLGDHILSEVSKEAKHTRMKIQYIPYTEIMPNPVNAGYSKDNIVELADSIRLSGGIKQPCIVKPCEDNKYMLLTGERRWLAIKHLVEEEDMDDFTLIPCQVEDPNNIDLPLSADEKELFSILVTNQYRDKTDADLFFEQRMWKELILKLRKAGVTEMAFFDAAGNEQTKSITGVKTRTLVSEQMGISAAQVGKIEKIENNGSDDLIESVENGDLSIHHASIVASLPKEEQDEVIDEIKGEEHLSESVIREKISKFGKADEKPRENDPLPGQYDFINPPEDTDEPESDDEPENDIEESDDATADFYMDDEMLKDLNAIVSHITECPHYWKTEEEKIHWKKIMKEIWNYLEV